MDRRTEELRRVFDVATGEQIGSYPKRVINEEIRRQFLKDGRVKWTLEVVHGHVLTIDGKYIMQLRAEEKEDNPGMWDKSLGGHVETIMEAGAEGVHEAVTAPRTTLEAEAEEELNFPLSVYSADEVTASMGRRHMKFDVLGVGIPLEKIDHYESRRVVTDGKGRVLYTLIQPLIVYPFLCYWDGLVRFQDKETEGVRAIWPNRLAEKLEGRPEEYTFDLAQMFWRYRHLFVPIDKQPLFKKDA